MGAREDVTADGCGITEFSAARLERVFDRSFGRQWHTRLQGGAQEPLYQPATGDNEQHVVFYRADYFASALHEVAHWCIAGDRRRLLPDYGYWYAPDGRNQQQQQAFEAVEYQPQALEWWFSQACAYRFYISVDNLDGSGGGEADTSAFARRISAQAQQWQRQGLPARAQLFFDGLRQEFGAGGSPAELDFSLDALA